MFNKIEEVKRKYVESLEERQEVKDAYIKCKGHVPSILKYIPFTDSTSKKRITDIIEKLIENGEVVKFPKKRKIAGVKNATNNEGESSGFNNTSTPSRKAECTTIIANRPDNLLYPIASSTLPHTTKKCKIAAVKNAINNENGTSSGFNNISTPSRKVEHTTVIANTQNNSISPIASSRPFSIFSTKSNESNINNRTTTSTFENINNKCLNTPNIKRNAEYKRTSKKLKIDETSGASSINICQNEWSRSNGTLVAKNQDNSLYPITSSTLPHTTQKCQTAEVIDIIDNEKGESWRFNNISTPSRKMEHTTVISNTQNNSIYPIASSTPFSKFSTNSFTNNTHIGIEDILRKNPDFLNNSRSIERTISSKQNLFSKSKTKSNESNINNSTFEDMNRKRLNTPNKKRNAEHERSFKKLNMDKTSGVNSINMRQNELSRSNGNTLVANNQGDNVKIKEQSAKNEPPITNNDKFKITEQTVSTKNDVGISRENEYTRAASSQNITKLNSLIQPDEKNRSQLVSQQLTLEKEKLTSSFSLRTNVKNVACPTSFPALNSRKEIETNTNPQKTTTLGIDLPNQSQRINIIQNVHLSTLNISSGNNKNDSMGTDQPPNRQSLITSDPLNITHTKTLSNLHQGESPTDHSAKQGSRKNSLPTTSSKMPSRPGKGQDVEKKLQKDVELTPSSKGKGIGKKRLADNLQNLDKSKPKIQKTENPANCKTLQNKGKSENANSEKSTTNALLGNKDTITINKPLKSIKTKKGNMATVEKRLSLIKELISKYEKTLPDNEKKHIQSFFNINNSIYQCICFELLTNERKWYNILDFCRKSQCVIEDTEVLNHLAVDFDKRGFIDRDYRNEHELTQLEQLDTIKLIEICDELEKENIKIYSQCKSEEKLGRKRIIEMLRSSCNTQSKIKLLKEKIEKKMGIRWIINKDFQDAFFSAYLLGTYTNPRFSKMENYFKCILIDKITFPEYSIDSYNIFTSKTDFISYAKAIRARNDFEKFLSDSEETRLICGRIFTELKVIESKGSDKGRFADAPHLMQFTAKSVYVNIISDAAEKLLSKCPQCVKEWLEYLLKFMKEEFLHEIGRWYHNLIELYMKHLKPLDYNHAGKLLIDVLGENKEKKYLSEIQLYMIQERGRILIRKKDILPMTRDRICELLSNHITIKDIPEKIVDEKSIMRKEELLRQRGTLGETIIATFILFFFDVIYSTTKFIPGAFVSDLQSEPLDLNTRYFYSNRKNEIDQRLREIENEWTNEKVLDFLLKQQQSHSHEFLINEIIDNPKVLEDVVQNLGRKVLANIFKRLVQNFGEYKIGFPDVLVNSDKRHCLAVVKRKTMKLSVHQILWLKYLRDMDVEVLIFNVSAEHCKTNIKKMDNENQPKTST